jgi:chorismate mutase
MTTESIKERARLSQERMMEPLFRPYRERTKVIDIMLAILLRERSRSTQGVGYRRWVHRLSVFDPEGEVAQGLAMESIFERLGLSWELAREIWLKVMAHSREMQRGLVRNLIASKPILPYPSNLSDEEKICLRKLKRLINGVMKSKEGLKPTKRRKTRVRPKGVMKSRRRGRHGNA